MQGKSWRNGVPPNQGLGATVASESLNRNPDILTGQFHAGEKHGGGNAYQPPIRGKLESAVLRARKACARGRVLKEWRECQHFIN